MSDTPLELSIVIPCLNEADTVGTCVRKALTAMAQANIPGEVVVADNGSTDGSRELAVSLGARVVDVPEKGYGAALKGGISQAKGTYIIMGDADDGYDFQEAPKFLDKLREGFDLVMGCRLPWGKGTVVPGAMPFLHRYLGNPMFSLMARWIFRCPTHDVYCGHRGFTAKHFKSLDMVCTGMEFAIEMIIRSCLFGARITEIPITLHRDGRQNHKPHLRTFIDGWRTLRLYMLYTPKWIFMLPGLAIILLGLLGALVVVSGRTILGVPVGTMTLLFSCMGITMGYQSVLFALMSTSFAVVSGILPDTPVMHGFYRHASLERGVILGLLVIVLGFVLMYTGSRQWLSSSFSPEDYRATILMLAPGITLACLGLQTILSTFFISMLNLRRQ